MRGSSVQGGEWERNNLKGCDAVLRVFQIPAMPELELNLLIVTEDSIVQFKLEVLFWHGHGKNPNFKKGTRNAGVGGRVNNGTAPENWKYFLEDFSPSPFCRTSNLGISWLTVVSLTFLLNRLNSSSSEEINAVFTPMPLVIVEMWHFQESRVKDLNSLTSFARAQSTYIYNFTIALPHLFTEETLSLSVCSTGIPISP